MAVQDPGLSGSHSDQPSGAKESLAILTTRKPRAGAIQAFLADDDHVPGLRALVTHAADGAQLSSDDNLPLNNALVILAGRRDIETWPALARLLRRQTPPDLIRGATLEVLPRIIATLFDGDVEALLAVAADRALSPPYRSTVLEAACFLTVKGRIARGRMQEFLASFPVDDTVGPENQVTGTWIKVIALLGLRDLTPLVDRRMALSDFGQVIPGRPTFYLMLGQAEEKPTDLKRLRQFGVGEIAGTEDVLPILIQDFADRAEAGSGDIASGPGVDDILADLTSAPYMRPATILACLKNFADTAPHMRAVIGSAAPAETLSQKHSILVCRCLYLLASKRDRASCQPVLRLLRRPKLHVRHLVEGTCLHLSNIIVGLFDWDAEALFVAISDPSADVEIRSHLLNATTFLTFQGKIPRDRMRRFLSGFDVSTLTQPGDFVLIESWALAIGMLGFRDLNPLVQRRAYVADFRDLDNFSDDPDRGEGYFEDMLSFAEKYPFASDRLDEFDFSDIANWDLVDLLSRHIVPQLSSSPPVPPAQPAPAFLKSPTTPVTNPWRDVGRNDPCPCGSGRKAKKCCLANKK
ncbi:MAG: SEC-C metal-binding domain-containing protein [Alphaproteobacteria bacterium]|nr:SEC-C metal-binding domain-containing protein [Alphaproteobacteria bacterium]